MYSLSPPTRNGVDDFESVVARRTPAVKKLLKQVRDDVDQAYRDYLVNAGNGALLEPISVDEAVACELKGNFRLLDKGRSHEAIRNEILGSTRLDVCPYCNYSTVDSLDHALPSAVYPEFAVLAQNLVPTCTACNRKKGQACFKLTGENLMHPYFVRIPEDPILFASVNVDKQGVTWGFYLSQNGSIEDSEFKSIENLFLLLDLADLYHDMSVGDVIDRTWHLDELHQAGGTSTVKKYLKMEAESARRSRGENYWKTAILRALAKSSAFCNGGYKKLR